MSETFPYPRSTSSSSAFVASSGKLPMNTFLVLLLVWLRRFACYYCLSPFFYFVKNKFREKPRERKTVACGHTIECILWPFASKSELGGRQCVVSKLINNYKQKSPPRHFHKPPLIFASNGQSLLYHIWVQNCQRSRFRPFGCAFILRLFKPFFRMEFGGKRSY